jgi:hypothetical protein
MMLIVMVVILKWLIGSTMHECIVKTSLRSVICDLSSFADDEGEEDESEKPYVRLSDQDRKHKPFYYGQRISKLGKAGKVSTF